jgi:thiol peroxidase
MTNQTAPERAKAITFKGQPMTLLGPELKAGDPAPAFHLTGAGLSDETLDTVTDGGKRAALLIVVPSLDTGVCSLESKTFNTRIAELGSGVAAYVVSMDLPFAMGRWAAAEGEVKLGMLSDYRTHAFGYAYGVRIKELGLLARTIFVIGKDKTVKYVELVPEVTDQPSYDATIAAAKAAGQ